jgi:DNA modification methylase
MKIVDREIRDLIPAEYNPRHLSEKQAEHLEASLKRFGAVDPAIINTHPDRKNIIIGGHQRLKTAQRLGWETFPCVELELDKEKERELNIRLNKNTGGWDYDALANYFEVEELTEWGFSDEELFADIEAEEIEAEEDDYQEPEDIKVDVVLGDLIEIGPHRLLCGDSTDSDQVAKLMNGEKADMVFTDPPYNISMGDNQTGVIGNNLKKQKQSISFISDFNPMDFLNTLPTVFGKSMNAYIFCNKDLLPEYLAWAKDAGYSFNVLIWKKPNAIPIKDAHRPDIEYLLLFRKSSIWNYGLKDVNYSRCLEYGRESGLHPTMKPIELISNELKISSNIGSVVMDFFLGSGSTMVASHQLKRKCYGMELDPKYCQVIIDRMKKLDDTLEIKINGEPYGI